MSSRIFSLLSGTLLVAALALVPAVQAQTTTPAPTASAPSAPTPPSTPGWHHAHHEGRFQAGPHRHLSPEQREARRARLEAHFFKAHGGTANGVTREDWMKHAAAQFDRLDINHDGVISPYELRIAARHWRHHHRHGWRHRHGHHGRWQHRGHGAWSPHRNHSSP
jgi:hypothetical protein